MKNWHRLSKSSQCTKLQMFFRTKNPQITLLMHERADSSRASLDLRPASTSSKVILFICACSCKDMQSESRRPDIEPLLPSNMRLSRRFALKPGPRSKQTVLPISVAVMVDELSPTKTITLWVALKWLKNCARMKFLNPNGDKDSWKARKVNLVRESELKSSHPIPDVPGNPELHSDTTKKSGCSMFVRAFDNVSNWPVCHWIKKDNTFWTMKLRILDENKALDDDVAVQHTEYYSILNLRWVDT